MLLYLERLRVRVNQYLKKKNTLDFSDWGVLILFILGLILLFQIGREVNLPDKITVIVLWFTAIAVIQNTKETYWLKQITTKQLEFQKAPLIIITPTEDKYASFTIKNIGKGAAVNIELRITQIHKNGGRSNLKDLADDEFRHFLNLGENEAIVTPQFRDSIHPYTNPESTIYTQPEVFAVIALYENISSDKFYSMSLFKVISEKQHKYTLKTTKFGSYDLGLLENVVPMDWLK